MSGTGPSHVQFQLLELLEVLNHHCSFSLNIRGLSMGVVLTGTGVGKGYSRWSPLANLRNLACAYLKGALHKLRLHNKGGGVDYQLLVFQV